MKRVALAVVVGAVIAWPGTAAAFGPSQNPNPKAVAACEANIANQFSAGISAGGGPKADFGPAINCDHFFQTIGAIGSGPPGGSQP
jgi:hypothetical protein